MITHMNSMMLCKKSNDTLKLNESLISQGKYILEGVVAELGTLNANHRIYTEEEYLKHLQYLRDDIKKGIPLLGELDHPEDRFEVKLKEASHRMLDLWYEPETHTVKCRLELLNTPNGLLAKSMVDQGVPLHISSRSAGTVNKNNTVSIQQIYTYDLVAKPGFPKAVLYKVNESVSSKYTKGVLDFLRKVEANDNKNVAVSYGMLNESVFVGNMNVATKIRKEALTILNGKENNTINIKDMSKKISESNVKLPQSIKDMDKGAEKVGIPTADMSLSVTEKDDVDQDKVEDKVDNTKSEKENKTDNSKDSYDILDIEPVFSDETEKETEEDTKEDTEKEETDEDNKKEEKDNTEKEENSDSKKTSDKGADKADESAEDKNAPKATKDNMLLDKKSEVASKREGFRKSIDELVGQLKKKKEVNEAMVNELYTLYPFTMYLAESNLNEFAKLDDKQKSKVVSYLAENLICEPVGINQKWKDGLNEDRTEEPIWLKYATKEQKELFESATQLQKDNLYETAKYIVFENRRDVDTFWEKSGLKTAIERRVLNEHYIKSLPIVNKSTKSTVLPYSSKDIELIANMACEYNRR